jgi:hypothetical protein
VTSGRCRRRRRALHISLLGERPTWKKWLDFLMDNNFKAANALLM